MRILCVFGQHNYGDRLRGEGYEFTNFLPALRALGHEVSLFDSWDRSGFLDFADLNRTFLQRIDQFEPDLIFGVLLGYELWSETLDLVRSHSNATVLNWGTDDSWKYKQFTRFMAPHVNWWATTYQQIAAQAHRDGINNLVCSQWAASHDSLTPPIPARQCRYQVSFVGSAYGNRKQWIKRLNACGIEVQCFGYGWPAGAIASADLRSIYRESVLTLNFGDSGLQFRGLLPYHSRQIKARVFEVPGGGGCLLTEPAEGLEQYFRIGEEIIAFEGVKELADRIRFFLAHPDKRDAVARQGFERVAKEHTYDRRFAELLEGFPSTVERPRRSIDWVAFESIAQRNKVGPWLRILGWLLVRSGALIWGKRRGTRAARRLVFELSWRLVGARTFSAAGWPGRMFYKEN
jgi:spore maturation protein CgeB